MEASEALTPEKFNRSVRQSMLDREKRLRADREVWWRKARALCRLQDNGIHYPYDHAED